MTADAVTIPADMPVPEVQARYFGAGQKHRAYPGVDDGNLLGMIVRDDLPPDVVQDEAQPVGELLKGIKAPQEMAEETCRPVDSRMDAIGLQRLAGGESEKSQKNLSWD